MGYLYQSQWPLLELLRGAAERPDSAITVELHDDVAWEVSGTATELLQLKHRLRSSGGLGDMAPEIWRTFQVWMDTQDLADSEGPTLTLLTTGLAADGSAAAALRPPGRHPAAAQRLLEAAARDSQSQETRSIRSRFLNLAPGVRETFIERIYVLDAAPTIGELDAEVRRELRWALPRGHEDTFMGLLWSWWFGKVIDMLQGHRRAVTGVDAAAVIDDLRDQFTLENLPTLVTAEDFDLKSEARYLDRGFVHQLHWVDTPFKLIQKAIVDYYRAYTQTARWIEDDLVGLDELEAFEKKVRDEWEREFEWMLAELQADSAEVAMRLAGLRLLRSTMQRTGIRVRERYDEAFFYRGKHHELADDGRVGWHPNFADLLDRRLLAVTS
jgi:hypothetical protein